MYYPTADERLSAQIESEARAWAEENARLEGIEKAAQRAVNLEYFYQNMAKNVELNELALVSLGKYGYLTTEQLSWIFRLPASHATTNKITRRMRRLAEQGLVKLEWKRSLKADALPPVWYLTSKGAKAAGEGVKFWLPYTYENGERKPRSPRLHTINCNTVALQYELGLRREFLPPNAKIRVYGELEILRNQKTMRDTLLSGECHQLPDVYVLVNGRKSESIWIELEQSNRSRVNLEKLADQWMRVVRSEYELRAKMLLFVAATPEVGQLKKRMQDYISSWFKGGWDAQIEAYRKSREAIEVIPL